MAPRWLRLARLLSTAVVVCGTGWIVLDAIRDWSLSDMDAYWFAAERLRHGEPLYVASYSVGAHDLYRHAPWFAFLWIPLTYLPKTLVSVGWEVALVGATAAATWPTLRRWTLPSTLLSILMGGLLIWTVAKANVHPLLIASLVLGVQRPSGPVWIALAASLKAAPIALVAVYIGRRQWGRATLTILLTIALTAPMLLFDLSDYPADPGGSASLFWLVSPGLWAVVALLAAAIAIALSRSRFGWSAGAGAVIAAFPRLLDYDATFLLVGTAEPRDSRSRGTATST